MTLLGVTSRGCASFLKIMKVPIVRPARTLLFRSATRLCAVYFCAWMMQASGLAQNTNGANDYLVDALRIDLNERVTINTAGYTTEPGEPVANGTRTAWFVWTAPLGTPSTVRFSTYGSGYNTTIALYKRSTGSPALVTSLIPVTGAPENAVLTDDDATIGVNTGYLTWNPQVGATYFVVAGRTAGNGSLEVTFGGVTAADAITPVVPNDNLATALEFAATVTDPATQVPRGQPVLGTTIAATGEAGEQTIGTAAQPRGGTVWYKYTVGPTPEVFSVAISDLPADTLGDVVLQAFANTLAPAAPTFAQLNFQEEDRVSSLAGTPRLVINAAANSQYFFRVTSTDGDGALYKIRLDFNPSTPLNDTIAAAIPLDSSLPSVRNQGEDIYSATATDPTGFNGNTSGANVWYSWRAPASGLVRIRAIAPTATAGTGNFASGSSFKFDAEIYFDTSNPTDSIFDTSTEQGVTGFSDATTPQERTFFAIKDVVYFIEIGGDNDTNSAGRGFFAFVLEDARLNDIARTGVSYGPEGVLKSIGLPVVNKTGDVAFRAGLELGGPVNSTKDGALFFNNGASTRVVVVEGEQEFGTNTDIDGDGINDDHIVFGGFSDLFLADRTQGDGSNADLGFTATLAGNSNDEPLTALNKKGLYRDDVAGAAAREFRLNDYVTESLTWNDGGGFLGSFNTPVRQANSNTALVTGKMIGIPALRDTAIFAGTRDVVLQEEDPAPNTADGVEFGDLSGVPTVNSFDTLAFRAPLRGPGVTAANDSAIYSVADYNNAPTALNYQLRLREGSLVPTAAGPALAGSAMLFTLGEPRVNNKGRLAVQVSFKIGSGTPAVSSANDTAILSDLVSADQSFAVVAREGDVAGGATGQMLAGVKFVSFIAPLLITNNAVVFTAKVSGLGVTKANDTGIWLWDGTSTYLVARKGDTPPGVVTSGARFKGLGTPLANPNGRIAFTASLVGSGITPANDAGLWTVSEDGVTPALRLRKGDVYNFDSTELPFDRTITSIEVTAGSAGDDGFARGMDQNGNVAVLIGLSKAGKPYGQAILTISP